MTDLCGRQVLKGVTSYDMFSSFLCLLGMREGRRRGRKTGYRCGLEQGRAEPGFFGAESIGPADGTGGERGEARRGLESCPGVGPPQLGA